MSVTNIIQSEKGFTFTLTGANCCFANALRRTILSHIDRVVLDDFLVEENTTSQFHNEIVKHRLQSIPVHVALPTGEEMERFCDEHFMELDVQNKTEEKMYVTSEHFRVINKKTGQPVDAKALFPPYKSFYYVDLLRLAPGRGETIQGERIKLRSGFAVRSSHDNSCYSVVSKCTYQNTIDMNVAMAAWDKAEREIRKGDSSSASVSEEVITVRKRDFLALDAARHFKPDSFDFAIRSNGIYEEPDLVVRGCNMLITGFKQLAEDVQSDSLQIVPSSTRPDHASSMEHSMDVVLTKAHSDHGAGDEEDAKDAKKRVHIDGYSVGYILDHLLYKKYVEGSKTLTYCGFAKFHPHSAEHVLRIAFRKPDDMPALAKTYIADACNDAVRVIEKIGVSFTKYSPAR